MFFGESLQEFVRDPPGPAAVVRHISHQSALSALSSSGFTQFMYLHWVLLTQLAAQPAEVTPV